MTDEKKFNMDDILDELLGRPSVSSFPQSEKAIEARIREYNERPQADLGGLSPDQIYRLLNGDWLTRGPLQLNESIVNIDLNRR